MYLNILFVSYFHTAHINLAFFLEEEDTENEKTYPRFIYFPDGDGNLVKVDLEAKPEHELLRECEKDPHVGNLYLLYTCNNNKTAQILVMNNASSIKKSNYNPSVPSVVIVHGYITNRNSMINMVLRDAFLGRSDVNVIVLDWSRYAYSLYTTAVRVIPFLGRGLAYFLRFLISTTGGSLNNVHLVGFSLGAHLVGNAGRELYGEIARITGNNRVIDILFWAVKTRLSRCFMAEDYDVKNVNALNGANFVYIQRSQHFPFKPNAGLINVNNVTALDPAGPLWTKNAQRINRYDAVYVEAIHTCGGSTGLGLGLPIAQADFFPNGGVSQPGCHDPVCDHTRAWQLFAATVTYDHLTANRCKCRSQIHINKCCGTTMKMGNDDLNKHGVGYYRVDTAMSYPYNETY
ncbi:pancreatic lipase-related protein 2-like [Ostrinia furnacalis]|uniref:pancreatic lipase-related protein 2-like n=1 Tax=Ostrinia furnacalis TaxID=93504 RepID=UPI001039F12A|nr:pancreatic lipase-related protein 2-like [Ostrinia furnacalis]